MPDIFVPQDIAPQGIADHHQPEVPTPVGRVHLNGYILVPCYLMDIAHALQITADCLLIDPVLDGKLLQCLLALHVIGYNLRFITANAAVKRGVRNPCICIVACGLSGHY